MTHDTANMLARLRTVLHQHAANQQEYTWEADAIALRRISMTLHRWHELECGDGNGCIERDEPTTQYPEGKPFWHVSNSYPDARADRRYAIPDRERGALRRLFVIMTRYPTLKSYVQGDPRGASLYILRPGDVLEGASIDSCYNRGVAVYK